MEVALMSFSVPLSWVSLLLFTYLQIQATSVVQQALLDRAGNRVRFETAVWCWKALKTKCA